MTSNAGSMAEAALCLENVPSTANRLGSVDELAGTRIVDLHYIDDVVVPTSSSEHCTNVWRGCEEHTFAHGGALNIGPTKSAVMPVGGTRCIEDDPEMSYRGEQICQVEHYPYLGFLLDRWLLFQLHFAQQLARGRDGFLDLYGCADSLAFPLPLTATNVPARLEGVVLYGMEFCLGVPGAESALNRLQAEWASHLLGIQCYREGPWTLLIAECGWSGRLGTRMLERAILLNARIHLLPVTHPAAELMAVAESSGVASWASQVRELSSSAVLPGPIPCITDTLSPDELAEARLQPTARHACIDRFRRLHVLPIFAEYDQRAFESSASTYAWPYGQFQAPAEPFPVDYFQCEWDTEMQRSYRVWAVVRVLGRWPLALYGVGDLPRLMPCCPLCGVLEATVVHLLGECTCTFCHYLDWMKCVGRVSPLGARLPWEELSLELFAGRLSPLGPDIGLARARFTFVAHCFQAAASAIQANELDADVTELVNQAFASSSDAVIL